MNVPGVLFGLLLAGTGAYWTVYPRRNARERIAGHTGQAPSETAEPAGVRVAGVRAEGVTLLLVGLFVLWWAV